MVMFIKESKCLEEGMDELGRKVWKGSEAIELDAQRVGTIGNTMGSEGGVPFHFFGYTKDHFG